jgi:hypothetical protein
VKITVLVEVQDSSGGGSATFSRTYEPADRWGNPRFYSTEVGVAGQLALGDVQSAVEGVYGAPPERTGESR